MYIVELSRILVKETVITIEGIVQKETKRIIIYTHIIVNVWIGIEGFWKDCRPENIFEPLLKIIYSDPKV